MGLEFGNAAMLVDTGQVSAIIDARLYSSSIGYFKSVKVTFQNS